MLRESSTLSRVKSAPPTLQRFVCVDRERLDVLRDRPRRARRVQRGDAAADRAAGHRLTAAVAGPGRRPPHLAHADHLHRHAKDLIRKVRYM